jgi:hypothetical protein
LSPVDGHDVDASLDHDRSAVADSGLRRCTRAPAGRSQPRRWPVVLPDRRSGGRLFSGSCDPAAHGTFG